MGKVIGPGKNLVSSFDWITKVTKHLKKTPRKKGQKRSRKSHLVDIVGTKRRRDTVTMKKG